MQKTLSFCIIRLSNIGGGEREMLHELEEKLQEMKKTNAQLLEKIAWLEEELLLLKRKQYGKSRESVSEEDPNQLSLFSDEMYKLDGIDSNQEVIDEIKVTAHRRKKKRSAKEAIIKELPIEETHHYLEGEAAKCDYCCHPLKEIGVSNTRDELHVIPAQLKIERHIQHAYECPNCKADGVDAIHKSDLPNKPLTRSLASASLLSEVIHQKFELFVPFYRQTKEWKQLGLDLSRRTLSNWVIRSAHDYLQLIWESLHAYLLEETRIHADETPVTTLASKKAKNYLWLFRTVEGAIHPITCFQFDETRKHSVAHEFLSGFKGYVHCDGYGAYDSLPDVTLVRCLAHIRRKFFEACGKDPSHTPNASKGVRFCDQLFAMEAKAKEANLTGEALLSYRKANGEPIFNQFKEWVSSQHVLAKTKFGEAIRYTQRYLKDLYPVFESADLSLSNNLAERTIRPVALGRKNWLFSQSFEGAQANAIILSLIQTAKDNGLNPRRYIQYLLEQLPNRVSEKNSPLEAYLPWAPEVQLNCK